MNATRSIVTRDGELDNEYAAFLNVLEAGFELRAVQQAQASLEFLSGAEGVAAYAQRIFSGADLAATVHATWDGGSDDELKKEIVGRMQAQWEQFATPLNGFRENDSQLPPGDPFRTAVIISMTALIFQNPAQLIEAGPGMPESVLEAKAANRVVEAVGETMNQRINDVEAKDPSRYRQEKFMQSVMGFFMGIKGFRSWVPKIFLPDSSDAAPTPESESIDPKLADIAEEAERSGMDGAHFFHLVQAAGTFFWRGMGSVFDQIEHEEGTRRKGDGETRILDVKKLDKLLHILSSRFIAGDTLEDVFKNQFVQELMQKKIEITVAHEAESTFDPKTGEENFRAFMECIDRLADEPEEDSAHPLKKFMSMKLSALGFFPKNPELEELKGELPPANVEGENGLKAKLRTLVENAIEKNVFIRIDIEYFIHKDTSFKIFKELLEENPEYADHLGIVVQAYLKDSMQDAEEMVAWAKDFHARTGKRVSLRLVKGANIKRDKKHARLGLHRSLSDPSTTWHGKPRRALEVANNDDPWDVNDTSLIDGNEEEPKNHPIAKDKATTQAQYIKIMKLFEENTDCLDVAYGTMNRDTWAHIIQTWLNHGEDLKVRQIQTLFGMYNSMAFAMDGVVSQRRYVPYGLLSKILAYMGRRFIELKGSDNGEKMPVMRHTGAAEQELRQVA